MPRPSRPPRSRRPLPRPRPPRPTGPATPRPKRPTPRPVKAPTTTKKVKAPTIQDRIKSRQERRRRPTGGSLRSRMPSMRMRRK